VGFDVINVGDPAMEAREGGNTQVEQEEELVKMRLREVLKRSNISFVTSLVVCLLLANRMSIWRNQ